MNAVLPRLELATSFRDTARLHPLWEHSFLRRCREAMSPDARLLLVELMVPADASAHYGKLFDSRYQQGMPC